MEFKHSFTVDAPVADVAAFHRDTGVLRQLTPLPIIAQIHEFEPLAENSNARFTLWFGPFPLRWHAIHSDVSDSGFTDTQVTGPLKTWRHSHRFISLGKDKTTVDDHIVFDHNPGVKGLLTRLLFNRLGLLYLFSARKYLTRRGVARQMAAKRAGQPA